jgi:hypothetical protein
VTNIHLVRLRQGLYSLLRNEKDKDKRGYIRGLLDDLRRGVMAAERQMFAAKMIGWRNPAFDGDYVGYPDDDFDDDERKK